MKDKSLLVIVDDARISRLICHVAEKFEMACLAVNRSDDIDRAYRRSMPDVILLDPEPLEEHGKDVLSTLAEHQTDAVIVMTNPKFTQVQQLKDLTADLGLNVIGVLPDIFDVEELKHKFISIIKDAGREFSLPPNANVNGKAPACAGNLNKPG